MLLELPRLTNSLRLPLDADQAYLHRKSFPQSLNRRSAAWHGESELARKIIYRWGEASVEVRQLYKEFVAAVVELMGGEVVSEEFQEVALNVYKLFAGASGFEDDEADKRILTKRSGLQKLVGHNVSEANTLKIASLVERLSCSQNNEHGTDYLPELVSEGTNDLEFGADLAFQPPARFLVDISLEEAENLVEEATTSSSNHEGWSDYGASANFHPALDGGEALHSFLENRDKLAMTICRDLDSEKPGDEIAGDLLDLAGDSSFEIVQDLVMHRKDLVESIHRGLGVLKSDKSTTNTQQRLPSYATQVTVQTESERQR